MTARILLTGFEPFGEHRLNPSERVLRPLAAAAPGGAIISTRVLPVSYASAFVPVRDALDAERFDAVILLGLGAGRSAISYERVAVNRRGSTTPDNDGVRVDDERIDEAGPAACFTTIPVDDLIVASLAAGAPAEGSDDAGTFLCNQVLYQTLRHCDRNALRVRAGFVHLPLLPEQAQDDEPALAEPLLIAGLAAALEALGRCSTPPEPAEDADLRP
jgi:pyroglutamyl-peptidase